MANDFDTLPAPASCQCEHVEHAPRDGCAQKPAGHVPTDYGHYWLCAYCIDAGHMLPAKPGPLVEVRRTGRTWSVFVDQQLHEGGFFEYPIACDAAQTIREAAVAVGRLGHDAVRRRSSVSFHVECGACGTTYDQASATAPVVCGLCGVTLDQGRRDAEADEAAPELGDQLLPCGHLEKEHQGDVCDGEPMINGPTCVVCDGPANYLGRLGHLDHFRCQNCGADFHREV